MKHLTLDEFLAWCKEHPTYTIWDGNKDIIDSLYLWRQSIEANSEALSFPQNGNRMSLRYKELLRLFGTEINRDLQQFYDDNKDET